MQSHTHDLSAFSFPWTSTHALLLSFIHTHYTLFQSVIYAFKHVFFFSFSHTREHIHLTVGTKQKNMHTYTHALYISTFMYIHRKRKVLFNVN